MDEFNSIQAALDIESMVDRTESRRKLMDVFTVYRRWKRIIVDDLEPDVIRIVRAAKPGYEHAQEPDLIRASGAHGSGLGAENPHLRRMRRFCYEVERAVKRLPIEQGEIIKRRFLVLKEPLPQDTEVFVGMQDEGLIYSERDYERKKAQALLTLGEALEVLVFKIPDGSTVI